MFLDAMFLDAMFLDAMFLDAMFLDAMCIPRLQSGYVRRRRAHPPCLRWARTSV
jgi:hypothetical protein